MNCGRECSCKFEFCVCFSLVRWILCVRFMVFVCVLMHLHCDSSWLHYLLQKLNIGETSKCPLESRRTHTRTSAAWRTMRATLPIKNFWWSLKAKHVNFITLYYLFLILRDIHNVYQKYFYKHWLKVPRTWAGTGVCVSACLEILQQPVKCALCDQAYKRISDFLDP